MAHAASQNASETMHEIIWYMPIQMVFKLVALNYQMVTGKPVLSHRDRYMNEKIFDKLEGIKNGS